ncbi:hypothetical protein M8R19_15345 [Pseudomonas sp. R3.Fl]|nr:hypothetical protein [Pseudomonas sp. R3.Fl]MCL6690082.1 hypothetical protein [Pseudomonas sp. R3.Fl]
MSQKNKKSRLPRLPSLSGCLAGEKPSAADLKMHRAATGPLLHAAPPSG